MLSLCWSVGISWALSSDLWPLTLKWVTQAVCKLQSLSMLHAATSWPSNLDLWPMTLWLTTLLAAVDTYWPVLLSSLLQRPQTAKCSISWSSCRPPSVSCALSATFHLHVRGQHDTDRQTGFCNTAWGVIGDQTGFNQQHLLTKSNSSLVWC